MSETYVVAHFVVTDGGGTNPVSAVADKLPNVCAIAFFTGSGYAEGEAVFTVPVAGIDVAGQAAKAAVDAAFVAIVTASRSATTSPWKVVGAVARSAPDLVPLAGHR